MSIGFHPKAEEISLDVFVLDIVVEELNDVIGI